ncbi:MAG: YceD family protein [Gammaproteobacteria bacterium]|jgi:uncharacterized protein
MSQRLPEQIEPFRLAEQGRIYKGQLPITKMKRLASLLANDAGDVDVDLEFSVDEMGQANVTGRVQGQVNVVCQRCMETMAVPLDASVSLGIVATERQVEELASQYEPLMVEDQWTSLPELVEDELILALPAVPMHEPEQCSVKPVAITEEAKPSDDAASTKKKNPFAVLEQLRDKSGE